MIDGWCSSQTFEMKRWKLMPKWKWDQNLSRAAQPWCVAFHFNLPHPLNNLFQNDDLYGDSESMPTAAVEADVVTTFGSTPSAA
jgi:hypothetical protein